MLAEYEAILEELRLDYPERPCVDWVSALKGSADLVFPMERFPGDVPDPFDEMAFECAIPARADFIVSGDKKTSIAPRQLPQHPHREPGRVPATPPNEKNAGFSNFF